MKGPMKNFSHTKTSHEQLSYFAQITMSHSAKIPDDGFITKQNEELQSYIAELETAFQRVLTHKFTQEINELDIRRDKLLVALRAALNSAIAQEVLSQKKADSAREVLVHMNNMDAKVTNLSLMEESVQINAFLSALKTLAEDVVTSSTAKPIIAALEETQKEFDKLYKTRSSHDETAQDPRRITQIRKDMVFRIEGLLSYINVNGVDYPETYSDVVNSINTLIDEVMAKAKADQTRKENQQVEA